MQTCAAGDHDIMARYDLRSTWEISRTSQELKCE